MGFILFSGLILAHPSTTSLEVLYWGMSLGFQSSDSKGSYHLLQACLEFPPRAVFSLPVRVPVTDHRSKMAATCLNCIVLKTPVSTQPNVPGGSFSLLSYRGKHPFKRCLCLQQAQHPVHIPIFFLLLLLTRTFLYLSCLCSNPRT